MYTRTLYNSCHRQTRTVQKLKKRNRTEFQTCFRWTSGQVGQSKMHLTGIDSTDSDYCIG